MQIDMILGQLWRILSSHAPARGLCFEARGLIPFERAAQLERLKALLYRLNRQHIARRTANVVEPGMFRPITGVI